MQSQPLSTGGFGSVGSCYYRGVVSHPNKIVVFGLQQLIFMLESHYKAFSGRCYGDLCSFIFQMKNPERGVCMSECSVCVQMANRLVSHGISVHTLAMPPWQQTAPSQGRRRLQTAPRSYMDDVANTMQLFLFPGFLKNLSAPISPQLDLISTIA